MNKTININLGGFFFHIDETAYLKLKRYLEAVSKSLNDDPQGKNEIIADIEARISELLSERIKDERQVVNDNDIEDIILIMGQPEDYADTEENYSQSSYAYKRNNTTSKKLFRDGEDKFLGGVASGLAHYLNLDPIWIRIIFILLATGGVGIGVISYIVLWILLPEATTTAEKLQMEGEPVNIDNIEKKIREELSNASEKIKDAANTVSEKVKDAAHNVSAKTSKAFHKKKTTNGLDEFLNVIGKIFMSIFKVISKIAGILLIITSSIVVLSSIIGIFSVGSLEALNFDDFLTYPPLFFNSSIPAWVLAILVFLMVIIPFVGVFVLGLRLLSNNAKRLNKAVSLSLLGIWIVSALILAFSIFEANAAFIKGEIYTKKQPLNLTERDTLKVSMVNNDDLHFISNFRRSSKKHTVMVGDTLPKTYTNNIRIGVEKSKNDENYIIIKKKSYGRNKLKAQQKAEEITYRYKINNNTLTLDAFFLSDFKTMHKDEMVDVKIFLSENNSIYFDGSTASFLYNVRNDQNFYHRELTNRFFIMGDRKLICTECKKEEDEENETITEENEVDI